MTTVLPRNHLLQPLPLPKISECELSVEEIFNKSQRMLPKLNLIVKSMVLYGMVPLYFVEPNMVWVKSIDLRQSDHSYQYIYHYTTLHYNYSRTASSSPQHLGYKGPHTWPEATAPPALLVRLQQT